jgi:multiple sugar transport system ATP-binding protein
VATIELRGVSKVFADGTVAVHGLDLDVGDGELFVIVGPSGCGKTSVLRMVAGLDEPSTGRILVDGISIEDQRTNERELAMLFQDSALYPHMTVEENLSFPLRMAKVAKREVRRRVGEVAATLGLDDVLRERPRRLSGGQQQRVAMGRAIIKRPTLLLMDEPMSNLDAKLRVELRSEIAAMQQRLGITTLYVTHDQVEAMALGHRIAVMRSGRVVQCGPPATVYREPVDVFVATFVGVPAMNVVLGEVAAEGDDEVAVHVGHQRIGRLLPVGGADLLPVAGRSVAVGIRPESFALDPDGDLLVDVVGVEHHGHERHVHAALEAPAVRDDGVGPVVDAGPHSTVIATLHADVEVDLWRPVRWSVTDLHLFDLDTGAALARCRRAARQPAGATVTGTPLSAMLPLTGS